MSSVASSPESSKLVWVRIGKTQHAAQLLKSGNSEKGSLVQWASTGERETVDTANIEHELSPRRRPRHDPEEETSLSESSLASMQNTTEEAEETNLVWVRIGKTQHAAQLLTSCSEKGSLVQWASTGERETVDTANIEHELTQRPRPRHDPEEETSLSHQSSLTNMQTTTEEAEEETNPYLALRRDKIARNEARMRELGLLKPVQSSIHSSSSQVKPPSSLKRDAKEWKPLRRSTRGRTEEPLRRSTRRTTEEDLPTKKSDESRETRQRQKKITPSPVRSAQSQVFPPHSARAMKLNIGKLVQGDGNTQGVMGRMMEHTTKAFVMEESARLAVEGHGGGNISFNKFSGVQEWGNDVIFLWVNLHAPGSEVVNEFLDDGRQVTWFGGSRMHDGTAVIRKLVQVGSATDLESSPSKGIVLWCRNYVQIQKSFTPYICLGRLSVSQLSRRLSATCCECSYLSHDALSLYPTMPTPSLSRSYGDCWTSSPL
jgi:hypothetical protein